MADIPYDAVKGEDLYDGSEDFSAMDDAYDSATDNPYLFNAKDRAQFRDFSEYVRGGDVIGNAKRIQGSDIDVSTKATDDILQVQANGDWKSQPLSLASLDKIGFNTSAGVTVTEGELAWNADAGTLDLGRPDGGATQLGQEIILAGQPRNVEAVQIDNGQVVYISGATAGIPEVMLSNAGILDARQTIAVCTNDVAAGARGAYCTKGVVRDFDTSAFGVNDVIWLDTTSGDLRNTPPPFPAWTVRIGTIVVSSATVGVLDVDIKTGRGEDLGNFFAGTFREGFNALVTSNGTIITLSLQSETASDLTMQFSSGEFTLDCTPAKTIALTAGTVPIPQENYVYILESTKALTLSLTQWPSAEHIKVGFFFCQTAAYVQSDGALINQNWNDPLYHSSGGHMAHITARIRGIGADWYDGLLGEGADDYTTSTAGVVSVQMGAGVIWQMHKQSLSAKDTSGTDDMHIINFNGQAYYETQNLYDVIVDAQGGTLNNKYFNIVLIAVGNKGGEYSPLLVNIPNGSYNSLSAAEADTSSYDVFDIPRQFTKVSSTAALVCRMTFRNTGGTWVYYSTVNLLGKDPTTATGGAPGGAVTNFSDSLFTIFNNIDSTKIIDVDASAITTGNTRTITMPDEDINLVNASMPNILINSNFEANQLAVTGSVVLSAGEYGHDGFYAGASGCSYTFAISNGKTTLTVSAGTLIQKTATDATLPGAHTLSWGGTATASLDGGSVAVSPITETLTGGVNVLCEWAAGTIETVKLEESSVPTKWTIDDNCFVESPQILKRFERINALSASSRLAIGTAVSATQARFIIPHSRKLGSAWTVELVITGSGFLEDEAQSAKTITGDSLFYRNDTSSVLNATASTGTFAIGETITLRLDGGYIDIDATGAL